MSLDYEIWSVHPLTDSVSFPHADRWVSSAGGWTYASQNWQIVIDQSIEVDEQDIPPEVGPQCVGVRFLTRVTLEPIHAPKAAQSLVRQVVRAVASTCRGIVLDLQTDTIIAASGEPRPVSFAKGETIELLHLSWWFLSGPLTTREGAHDLITYFQTHLPQFMPRRYGRFEPPKFRFDPDNPQPFFDFLLTEPMIIVWKPEGKFFGVSYPVAQAAGWQWRPGLGDSHFFVPHLELSCPAKLLEDPAWDTALRRCWKTVSKLAKPFYGDVRVLGGYHVRGGSVFSHLKNTESHPIGGPWLGLPKTFGLATVMGNPYLDLMPDFAKDAEVADGLAFRSLETWREGGDVTSLTGPPRPELCQLEEPRWVEQHHRLPDGSHVRVGTQKRPRTRAAVWPFPSMPDSSPPSR